MKQIKKKYVIDVFLVANIIIPLLVGALVYCSLSNDIIFQDEIRGIFNLTPVGQKQQHYGITRLIRNFFPDMLWGYALVFGIFISIKSPKVEKILLVSITFSAIVELLQKFSLIPGTFDIYDIIVEIFSEVLAMIIIKNIAMEGTDNEKM